MAILVDQEYRKFLFLMLEAGHPVTPSDEVDQAWHLHLLYTESYWDDLCGRIVGRPLHHGPTAGGSAESAKYVDWYEATLASYRRLFQSEPPSQVWPSSEARFADADSFLRINTRKYLLVPNPMSWVRSLLSRWRSKNRDFGLSQAQDR